MTCCMMNLSGDQQCQKYILLFLGWASLANACLLVILLCPLLSPT